MGTWTESDNGNTPAIFLLSFEHTNGVIAQVSLLGGSPENAPFTEGTAVAEQVIAAVLADTDFALLSAYRQYPSDSATYTP